MTYFITNNGRVDGGINDVAKEAAVDCATIAVITYYKLLEMGEQYARAYIGYLGEFAGNPNGFIATYMKEE